jgi:hypothetical protein
VEALGRAAEAGFVGDGAKHFEPEILHGSTLAGSWELGAGRWSWE